MTGAYQIEGYAIVSQDGMLADANGVMPDSLKFKADYAFFEAALDAVDLVLHGRHSQEQQPLAAQRRRLILTQRIAGIAADPSNPNALLWNPSGASFEDAVAAVGLPVRRVGVIGGTDVFAFFLDRFDAFHLTHAPNAWLPGGRPVFPDVPRLTPEDVLAEHGLHPEPPRLLDATHNLLVVTWQRHKAKGPCPLEPR
jgi:dihydrofolate reductase